MEPIISNRTIEVEHLIGTRAGQALVHAETMVSGAGREQVVPLMEDATLTIGQAEVQHDRVVLDGVVVCQALYRQGDEISVRALTATANLSHVLDMPGAGPGMILRVTGRVEHTETQYQNGHMVFKVVCGLRAEVLQLQTVELIEDVSGVPGLEARYQELSSSKLSAESTAEAVLREAVSLPGELDARMSLMDFSNVRIKESAPDLGGIRIKGEVMTETLIGTGVPGRPVAKVTVSLPFDQLVEMPEWLTQNATADAQVTRMTTQVHEGMGGEDATLTIECQLTAYAGAKGQDDMRALVDAYSTSDTGLDVTQAPIELSSGEQRATAIELFKGTLLMPEGAPSVGTVLAVRIRPSLSEWSAEGGRTTLAGVMEAQLLYLPNGGDKLNAVREELPFQAHMNVEVPQEAWMTLNASNAEAGAQMGDRLELRCQLKIEASYRQTETAIVATALTETGPQKRKEGILMVWPDENDDLWSIGKRYHVGTAVIADLNGNEQPKPGKALILRM